MISLDTNVLLPAVETGNPHHVAAAAFVGSLLARDDVALSEFVLLELYGLLRNPAVLGKPLNAIKAATLCQRFREHPRWAVLALPGDVRGFHDQLWAGLGRDSLPRRAAYDLRLGLSLRWQGVKEFATVNVKDFQGIGFRRVWNPLAP